MGGAVKLQTNVVAVKVYTADFVIEGHVHTKTGGYKDRVSDMVNEQIARFLVLTDVIFRPAGDEKAPAEECSTMILRLDEVKMIIPLEETEHRGEGAARPSGKSVAPSPAHPPVPGWLANSERL
jgi:hypothetical protein